MSLFCFQLQYSIQKSTTEHFIISCIYSSDSFVFWSEFLFSHVFLSATSMQPLSSMSNTTDDQHETVNQVFIFHFSSMLSLSPSLFFISMKQLSNQLELSNDTSNYSIICKHSTNVWPINCTMEVRVVFFEQSNRF